MIRKFTKKILQDWLNKKDYKKILSIIIVYRNFIFLNKSFLKKFTTQKLKLKKINQNLIIISQIQRSGGTLLSQLFDTHPEIHSYPSELKLTNPKHDWTKKFNFTTFYNDQLLVSSAKYNNYKKDGSGSKKKQIINEFKFDFFLQKKIYEDLDVKNNLRNKLNAYFTSFFNSFLNYNNNNNLKKYIIAFLPRFIFKLENLDLFFNSYKNGKILCIIRSPNSWLSSSTNHSEIYKKNPLKALMLWKINALRTINAKKKFGNNIIIIDFDDLINNTENIMKKLCKTFNIKFHKTLKVPSFNGEIIRSNSSFNSIQGKIDKKTLKRKLSKQDISNCSTMLYECNIIKNDILKLKI
ncbi:sulfotransferase [Candidatus Pelagibacter sp.]|nr:sulfotransferase [Candidatus Pelagibacter sp.]